MEKEIKVTVFCIVYNHGKYVRECLDSLLMQKTDFEYEIIVHDDASTDDSAKIIAEYAEKYPDKIVPILQTENQFSKRIKIINTFMLPLARGKYIAICEGDDYWTVPDKLQKQADALDAHPECSMSVHKVERVSFAGEILGRPIPKTPCKEGVVSAEEVIQRICSEYAFHTSSFFMRREYEQALFNPMPRFREVACVGDEPRMMFFATKGDFYYFDEPMSHYRKGVAGSYTTAFSAHAREKQEKSFRAAIAMLQEFDAYTNQQYHPYIERRIRSEEYYLLSLRDEYRELFKKRYRDVLKEKPFNAKVYVFLGAVHPKIPKLLWSIKKKIQNRL